jgi:hypothetical protein
LPCCPASSEPFPKKPVSPSEDLSAGDAVTQKIWFETSEMLLCCTSYRVTSYNIAPFTLMCNGLAWNRCAVCFVPGLCYLADNKLGKNEASSVFLFLSLLYGYYIASSVHWLQVGGNPFVGLGTEFFLVGRVGLVVAHVGQRLVCCIGRSSSCSRLGQKGDRPCKTCWSRWPGSSPLPAARPVERVAASSRELTVVWR